MDGNQAGSFFIDEEKKIVVVVDLESYKGGIVRNQKTNVIGQDGYFKSLSATANHANKPTGKIGCICYCFDQLVSFFAFLVSDSSTVLHHGSLSHILSQRSHKKTIVFA
ncbi:hypothetical protein YC2023_012671 [Brassica napus]